MMMALLLLLVQPFFLLLFCVALQSIILNVPDLATGRLIIFLLGKFGISLVFTCLYLFTSELYPTQYRHSLLAFSSMIGRIGSITAPLTPALVNIFYIKLITSHRSDPDDY
jgi:hypothetical protein